MTQQESASRGLGDRPLVAASLHRWLSFAVGSNNFRSSSVEVIKVFMSQFHPVFIGQAGQFISDLVPCRAVLLSANVANIAHSTERINGAHP